jgi:hypothetical protein
LGRRDNDVSDWRCGGFGGDAFGREGGFGLTAEPEPFVERDAGCLERVFERRPVLDFIAAATRRR